VRKGLMSILSLEDNVEEIKEASNAAETIVILKEFNPDIVIIDLRLGKDDGLDVVAKAKGISKSTKYIVLTSSSRRDDFLRAQEIGVDGYILKEAFIEDIMYAFHVVTRGKKFFDPEMLQHAKSEEDEFSDLTPREKDVLLELGRGLSNIQIAQTLYISENTVKKHISSIFSKLGLNHRLQAAVFVNNKVNFEH
ncbi:MAG: two component transcriptional regulator, LuxR family, partial [Anaerocolumna sp.]|nr:two component transcriptional regulator, LuxR family [Anaerocolumna sp.]